MLKRNFEEEFDISNKEFIVGEKDLEFGHL